MKNNQIRLSARVYNRLEKIAQANSVSPDRMASILIENYSDVENQRLIQGGSPKNFEINRTVLFIGAMFLIGMLLAIMYILSQTSF